MKPKTIAIGVLLLLISMPLLVRAEINPNLGGQLGEALRVVNLDIGPLYAKYPEMIDFIVYIILFIFIFKVVFAKKFGPQGSTIATMFAIIFAVGASIWEYQTGWNMGEFIPPIAGAVVVVLIGFGLYQFIKWIGGSGGMTGYVAYIIAFLVVKSMAVRWRSFGKTLDLVISWILFFGNWLMLFMVIGLIINLIKAFGKSKELEDLGKGSRGLGGAIGGLFGGLGGGIAGGASKAYNAIRNRTKREQGIAEQELAEEAKEQQLTRQLEELTKTEIKELVEQEIFVRKVEEMLKRARIVKEKIDKGTQEYEKELAAFKRERRGLSPSDARERLEDLRRIRYQLTELKEEYVRLLNDASKMIAYVEKITTDKYGLERQDTVAAIAREKMESLRRRQEEIEEDLIRRDIATLISQLRAARKAGDKIAEKNLLKALEKK
ncbi:hypothetical protein DRJ48_05135, partial [Candidatus Woesearchaeota archaeon]